MCCLWQPDALQMFWALSARSPSWHRRDNRRNWRLGGAGINGKKNVFILCCYFSSRRKAESPNQVKVPLSINVAPPVITCLPLLRTAYENHTCCLPGILSGVGHPDALQAFLLLPRASIPSLPCIADPSFCLVISGLQHSSVCFFMAKPRVKPAWFMLEAKLRQHCRND